uniref:Uncharacterized protein n=1 Tax=Arundo donax TaxID=35708 RepID=A0A0A9BEV3_ARUDO
MERVDLDRSPSPQDDKSAPNSPVYNGKASGSMNPNGRAEGDAKVVEASEKPDTASPVRYRKNRDEEEGVIDEDGEIAEDDPRSSAPAQNGDDN